MALTAEGAALTELHKLLQLKLSSQSMATTKLLWSSLDPSKGAAAMDGWLRQQVALSGVFDGKSAALAADYVKKFRAAEGFPGGPVVGVQDYDPNWASQTLAYNGPAKVNALMAQGVTAKEALMRAAPNLLMASQRVSLNGGRRVVDKSALANPDSTGWRRVSDGRPCAFCAMIVSRGPAYRSEKSAGAGRHWHKRCGCTVEEIFGEWIPTDQEQRYLDEYNQARADLKAEDRVPDTTNILEKMRLNGKFNDSPVTKPKPVETKPESAFGAKPATIKIGGSTTQVSGWNSEYILEPHYTDMEMAAQRLYASPTEYAKIKEAFLAGEPYPMPAEHLGKKLSAPGTNLFDHLKSSMDKTTLGEDTVLHRVLKVDDKWISDLKPGSFIESPYFSSTSFNPEKATSFGALGKGGTDVHIKILAPAGTHIAPGFAFLEEAILEPGTKMVVRRLEKDAYGKVTVIVDLQKEKMWIPSQPKYLPPIQHPTLGPNFRVTQQGPQAGQVWKGYKFKVHGQEGVSWKKVNEDGSVLAENKTMPTKKQLAEAEAKKAAAKKAAEEAAAAEKAAAEAAAKKAAEQKAILDKLGGNFRIGTDGTIWKGYKYKIQGKEGVSWKKVDESGKRINVDPPPKAKVKKEPVTPKVTGDPQPMAFDSPEAKTLKPADGLPEYAYKQDASGTLYKLNMSGDGEWMPIPAKPPGGASYLMKQKNWIDKSGNVLKSEGGKASPALHVDAPPVVLKNQYQKDRAAAYGWRQTELQAWVKSGKTMQAYHASLQPGYKASASPPPLVNKSAGAAKEFVKRGSVWANKVWPPADAFPSNMRQALRGYTGSDYTIQNPALRASKGKRGMDPHMDAAFDHSPRVPEDTLVLRGVRDNFAVFGEKHDLTKIVGKEYTEYGYMSTAVDKPFGGTQMHINLPKGHKAVYVSHERGAISRYGTEENELLLDRGTKYTVKKAEKIGDQWHVYVDVHPGTRHMG